MSTSAVVNIVAVISGRRCLTCSCKARWCIRVPKISMLDVGQSGVDTSRSVLVITGKSVLTLGILYARLCLLLEPCFSGSVRHSWLSDVAWSNPADRQVLEMPNGIFSLPRYVLDFLLVFPLHFSQIVIFLGYLLLQFGVLLENCLVPTFPMLFLFFCRIEAQLVALVGSQISCLLLFGDLERTVQGLDLS